VEKIKLEARRKRVHIFQFFVVSRRLSAGVGLVRKYE